ncbi:MAG: hypothetical protein R6U10_06155 [Thermoplasmatota archaeon]
MKNVTIETVVKAREEMLQRLYMYALEHGATPMPAGEFPEKIDDNVRAFNIYYLREGGYIAEEPVSPGGEPGYRVTAQGIRLFEELYGKYNI